MNTKKSVLELLEESRGEPVSGEKAAALLQVSRNAVWKAVRELKKDGYQIEATTKKGYRFCETNDILSAEGMKPYLKDSQFSENICVFPVLESTNFTAKEAAVNGAPHGSVTVALRQTFGKGRYSRTFFAPTGGIYMSFILRPEYIPFKNATTITAFAAISVCESIEAVTGKNPSIKWVNDIFLSDLKICGISTEAATELESGSFAWIVLGIGINYDTREFPENLAGIAGSIYPNGNAPQPKNRLAAEVINRILSRAYPTETEVFAAYKKRLMMLGKNITVYSTNETYEATAIDIDEAGRLIVQKQNGETCALFAGEISLSGKK